MKGFKRFAAALVAFAVMAVMLPCMAFAADENAAKATVVLGQSYTIKKGATDLTTVNRYDTGMTLTIPYTITATSADYENQTITYTAKLDGVNFAQTAGGTTTVTPDTGKESFTAGQDGTSYTTSGTVTFTDVKYFGEKNQLTITFTGNDTNHISKNPISASLTIGEAQPTVVATATPAPTSEPTPAPTTAPTADPRAPGLIIKSSSISEESVNAGDEFTLNLTVYATSSGTENINDALVSIVPDKGVIVAKGSSTNYIGSMKPGSTKTVSFPMKALADFTEGVSTVTVSLSGIGEKTGSAANATGTTISVPITQADRFQISKVEVPESIMVGEEQMATITFVNMGKNAINNLTVALSGQNIQEASQSQYVGNLAAGTENSVDFNLMPLEAGTLTGTIMVTYEGANGQTVTLTQDIAAAVEDMGGYDDGSWGEDGGDMPIDAPVENTGLPMWATVLIIVVAVSLVVVLVVLICRRKAKKQKALEAEDEDL